MPVPGVVLVSVLGVVPDPGVVPDDIPGFGTVPVLGLILVPMPGEVPIPAPFLGVVPDPVVVLFIEGVVC
jgi:hypothetical protein